MKKKNAQLKSLSEKIESRTAKISIIGLGYVGLPLSLLFAEKGFQVVGFDKDENKVAVLKKGKCYITEDLEKDIRRFVKSKVFMPTADEKVEMVIRKMVNFVKE